MKARYEKAIVKVVDLDDYATEDDQYEQELKKETLLFSCWQLTEMESQLIMLRDFTNGLPRWGNKRGAWSFVVMGMESQLIMLRDFTNGLPREMRCLASTAYLRRLQSVCNFVNQVGKRNCLVNKPDRIGGLNCCVWMNYSRCIPTSRSHLTAVSLALLPMIFNLTKRGAKCLIPVGLGDDDQCIEDDFAAWRETLWPELDKLLQDEDDTNTVSTPYTAVVPEYRVVIHDPTTTSYEDRYLNMANGNASYDIHHLCRINVAVRRELHKPESDRSCIHLEFDKSRTGIMQVHSVGYPN
ncbi:P450 reductase 1 [Actinidia rufa]|uniref:P450 reductase 1 n=1 Tax=Actinidia rufa TaxID=165716 RepID=A0A7J0FN82_9ERIC|nr:P450 reductase 1 [Actinidia rufa]